MRDGNKLEWIDGVKGIGAIVIADNIVQRAFIGHFSH